MDATLKSELKKELDSTLSDCRQVAIANALERYSLPAQIIGVAVGVVGGGLLSTVMPGGVIASALIGFIISGAATKLSDDEAQAIERGDLVTLKRYYPKDQLEEKIKPLLQKAAAAKKPPAQELQKIAPQTSTTTETVTGSQSPEPAAAASSALPVAPVQLSGNAPHLLLFGRSQNGKTNTAAHVLADIQVDYISLKASDTVPDSWNGYLISPTKTDDQLNWVLDQWELMLNTSLESDSKKAKRAFVVDEYISIYALVKNPTKERLKTFYIRLLTTGAGLGLIGGILTQTSNAGALDIPADILKNCSTIAVTGEQKNNSWMAKVFSKFTGYQLDGEQKKQVKQLSGYWQIWDNDGPCLSQVPVYSGSLKPLENCPTNPIQAQPEQASPTDNQFTGNPFMNKMKTDKPTKTIEERIVEYFKKTPQFATPRTVYRGITITKADGDIKVGDIRDKLIAMSEEESPKIQMEKQGHNLKFGPVVTQQNH
ncbi:MAG: hypothetical protein AAGH78_01305 [Cyanobacteria bacterium P01_H01_bin.58]